MAYLKLLWLNAPAHAVPAPTGQVKYPAVEKPWIESHMAWPGVRLPYYELTAAATTSRRFRDDADFTAVVISVCDIGGKTTYPAQSSLPSTAISIVIKFGALGSFEHAKAVGMFTDLIT
jgi:hypothetical protein